MLQHIDIYKESETLYTDCFLKSFFEQENKLILIALFGDKVVAYGFLEHINVCLPMMQKRKYTYIHDFAVFKKYQSKGVATRLLSFIEEQAIKNGSSKIELAVHLFSIDAIRLYKKMGFESRSIRMEKDLISNLYK